MFTHEYLCPDHVALSHDEFSRLIDIRMFREIHTTESVLSDQGLLCTIRGVPKGDKEFTFIGRTWREVFFQVPTHYLVTGA